MSSLSIPPSGYNNLQKIGFWAVKATATAAYPWAGPLAATALDKVAEHVGKNRIDKLKDRFEAKAKKFWNEKIAHEDASLSEAQEEQLYFIAHRFFQTVSQGTVNRNLHLLAKLIRKQIDEKELSYEKYVTLDNAIRDLSLKELVCLSELCLQIGTERETTNKTITIENYTTNDFEKLQVNTLKKYEENFKSVLALQSTFTLLSGKGWTICLTPMQWGGVTQPYFVPSNLVSEVKVKIAEFDLVLSANTEEVEGCTPIIPTKAKNYTPQW